MRQLKQTAVLMMLAAAVFLAAGCNETYAQKKRTMEGQWEKSTAMAKLRSAEDMISRGELDRAKDTLNRCLVAIPENAEVHLLVGRIHFIEGRTDQALRAFQTAVELDSQLDRGWYYLGSLSVMDGNYKLAMEHYQKALTLQPANTDYLVSAGELYIEMEQPDLAKAIIEKGLSKRPNDLGLMITKSRLYIRMGDRAAANQVYEQALLIHGNLPQILEPCGYSYMAQGQWGRAAEKFELLLNQKASNSEHYNVTLRSLAICSFNDENYGRALTCYNELTGIYRDDPEAWLGMAQSALGLGDAKRAVSCAEKALQLRPSWGKGHLSLASALYLQGDYSRSLAAFGKLTSNDEYAAFAWFMSGRCYRQMGQTVQAERAFERAEKLDPNNELVRQFLKKTVKFL